MTCCSITDMSGSANSPPLNAAIGVLSSSGSTSIDMPRGGRLLVTAKSIPATFAAADHRFLPGFGAELAVDRPQMGLQGVKP